LGGRENVVMVNVMEYPLRDDFLKKFTTTFKEGDWAISLG